ncbi:hypothetical protein FS749_011124 [Ceratobasidium sp. UAMH 11750]|nr:hypothetical protein FS749_011124 [Ceratobasidium sp. UAMH 11750]
MLFAAFSILTLGLSSVLAEPFSNRSLCNTIISADEKAEAEDHFVKNKVSFALEARAEYAVNIMVYWHVIQSGANLTQGNIPDSQINGSISALNTHYSGSGITFTLAGTDRTINATWFTKAERGTTAQTEMKKKLRQGDATTLNVYTVGFPPKADTLGYATFPRYYADNPQDDGVVIKYSTVPGGSFFPFDEGKTLTHEAGHWLGLYHTFQGGCKGGDSVDDTPPEASPAYGCATGRDTCKGGGVDPIHNYMDYSDDQCMTEFTPGQIIRMREQIATYRGIKPNLVGRAAGCEGITRGRSYRRHRCDYL